MHQLLSKQLINLVTILALSSMAVIPFSGKTEAIDKSKVAKVLVVRTTHTYKAKVESLKSEAKAYDIVVTSKLVKELKDVADISQYFSGFDMVFFDAASQRETKQQFTEFEQYLRQSNTRFVAFKWHKYQGLNKNISVQQADSLSQFYDNGGRNNFARMSKFLRNRVFDNDSEATDGAIIYPEVGIYHPQYSDLIFDNLNSYQTWLNSRAHNIASNSNNDDKLVIGVMMQRALIESSQTDVVDETIKLIEAKGAVALPFFFEVSPKSSPYQHLLTSNGEKVIDAIINFRTIHWANKRKQEFEEIDVPILQALTYFNGNQKDWEDDNQGISANMTPFLLVLPETSGVIDPQIIAARNNQTEGSEVINYQLSAMINKALNHASLSRMKNKNKKLTVFFWGDRDMGASFLNVPQSLANISKSLNKEGYAVKSVKADFYTDQVNRILDPFYRDYQLDKLIEDDQVELMPVEEYLAWFNQLPVSVSEPINEQWGHPNDNFMVVNRNEKRQFVIPRIRNGNLLVLRQPPRSDDKDQAKLLYHKGDVPMNHYYLAAYFYARKYWKSDAIIHLGTHGSQEYLGGKERGLSQYDGPNLAVGDTPIFYPFIVDDVGEAMQTKRRGSATVISHMTPPFAAAGLQGETADMHELLHQYKSLDEGGVKTKTSDQIMEKCLEAKLCKDLGWNKEAMQSDFAGFMATIHDYLEDLAVQNQPLGLHSYGELAENKLLTSTLIQMLGKEFVTLATEFERNEFNLHSGEKINNEVLLSNIEKLDNLPGFRTSKNYIVDPVLREKIGLTLDKLPSLTKELSVHIKQGKELFRKLISVQEIEHLVHGLSGGFIPTKNGGDPIRHPESLPTGYNLVGFDPSRLPTEAAYEQGKELVEQVINEYYSENKVYPDKLAFSLWSIEAMRHYGVLESQALYAMGVRPKWSKDGRVIGTEIIPASELKRPRVDIVLSATGLYRDAFPNVLQRLAKAIEQVSKLKEKNNSIWTNSQRIQAHLISEGIDQDEAQYLSSIRIFSNASGQYGSGTDGPVFASDTWENDKKISDNYLSKMGYAFGTDSNRWGEMKDGLGLYAKQLSGTDVALFSRSSNIFGMLSSDDPFEYFGSLSLAVRNIDGKSPKMMVSNLRSATNSKMEDAAQFLAKELRTRQFHKRWIQEMQKEGYSGAVSMASQVANFWGWQVVDPNLVRDDQWQSFHEIYVQDKYQLKMNEWFETVNPGAQVQLIKKMLEAVRKDYWQASAETKKQLIERYLHLVNEYDLINNNKKLEEFVNEGASGFGLELRMPNQESVNIGQNQNVSKEQITGQKLEKVEEKTSKFELRFDLIVSLTVCFAFLLFGMYRQSRRSYTGLPV